MKSRIIKVLTLSSFATCIIVFVACKSGYFGNPLEDSTSAIDSTKSDSLLPSSKFLIVKDLISPSDIDSITIDTLKHE